MKLSVLLFDGFTAIDVVGGYEVLARIPGVTVEVAAASKGPVATDTRALGFVAYRTFRELESTELLYVPGGPGVEAASTDDELLACIRRLHATSTWTIGICNGVGLLAAAGVLEGRSVTTNWDYREKLTTRGIQVVRTRYQQDGKILTSAGASACIDAGLFLASRLAGDDVAKLIQLGIEYYPAPPLGGTCADDAPAAARHIVRMFNEGSVDRLRTTRAPF